MLNSSCIPVKGINRSLIIDLSRESFIFIPNDLYFILEIFKDQKVSKIYQEFGNDNATVLDSYFELLESYEMIHYFPLKRDLNMFTPISTNFEYPSLISNIQIELFQLDFFNLIKGNILNIIESFNVKALEIHYFEDNKNLQYVLETFCNSRLTDINILTSTNVISKIHSEELLLCYPKLSKIVISDSELDSISKINRGTLITQKSSSDFKNECGCISKYSRIVNRDFYLESISSNNCLSKKLSIDKFGTIKNCLSMKSSYGNINNVNIKEIITSNEFLKFPSIKKDNVLICKDCEFRYLCLDCRVFLENKEDIFSKPLKCGYDPYNTTFIDWKKDPIKINKFNEYKI